ncbi:acetolactate synthase [Corynebacterium sphenisci DSM 44792]|uniref:Acetolactate synthase small subunit n=1 Tax=Corynebacterium sphenisci DSM 44792 TaxID=1437874 RepID=A0A1L7CX64_9CORY|nr:acetolactate synthase small subunit [Corynebacterium sphenisci]APT90443.1 acetolactate synthase [Corynebacterium sphenisci DSM 44792]
MAELHTLSVLTLDEPGILVRIAGMFTRRGFSIQSITSGQTEVDGVNRITLVVETEDLPIEQITKQLNKLVPVIKVVRKPADKLVSRALLMVKVSADNDNRPQVVAAAELFRARVVDVCPESVVIEATGQPSKLRAMLEVLEPFGIRELVQSGVVAVARGPRPMLTDRG